MASSRFYADLDQAARSELSTSVKASAKTLRRIEELLDRDIKSLEAAQESRESYNCPSWALLQADHIGGIRELKKIKKLIQSLTKA
jgi:hypothetical protein